MPRSSSLLVPSAQLLSLKHSFLTGVGLPDIVSCVVQDNWTPHNRVLVLQEQETEMSAGERELHRSPHEPASRAGSWAISSLTGESENLSASEA